MKTARLFVYGTLAPGQSNEHVLGDVAGEWVKASVRGTLYQQGWGADLGCPGMVPDSQGEVIKGLLFCSAELPQHWDRLDEFEGEEYRRVQIQAELESGEIVDAQIYSLAISP